MELGAPLELDSNSCGRDGRTGGLGTPIDLALGGNHTEIVTMLDEAIEQ